MTGELTFYILRCPDGGYRAWASPESIFTEADNLNELEQQISDAIYCHFGVDERPAIIKIVSLSSSRLDN